MIFWYNTYNIFSIKRYSKPNIKYTESHTILEAKHKTYWVSHDTWNPNQQPVPVTQLKPMLPLLLLNNIFFLCTLATANYLRIPSIMDISMTTISIFCKYKVIPIVKLFSNNRIQDLIDIDFILHFCIRRLHIVKNDILVKVPVNCSTSMLLLCCLILIWWIFNNTVGTVVFARHSNNISSL